jgi:lipoprotein NlpD
MSENRWEGIDEFVAVAEMGSTGTDRVKLHFEIRRQGKPVDPLQFLPRR